MAVLRIAMCSSSTSRCGRKRQINAPRARLTGEVLASCWREQTQFGLLASTLRHQGLPGQPLMMAVRSGRRERRFFRATPRAREPALLLSFCNLRDRTKDQHRACRILTQSLKTARSNCSRSWSLPFSITASAHGRSANVPENEMMRLLGSSDRRRDPRFSPCFIDESHTTTVGCMRRASSSALRPSEASRRCEVYQFPTWRVSQSRVARMWES